MAENQKNVSGIVENLAIATDKLQETYPSGKIAIIVELDNKNYIENQFNLDMYDQNTNQFKIDISDVEIIFIRENKTTNEEKKVVVEEKKTFFKKIIDTLKFKNTVKNLKQSKSVFKENKLILSSSWIKNLLFSLEIILISFPEM